MQTSGSEVVSQSANDAAGSTSKGPASAASWFVFPVLLCGFAAALMHLLSTDLPRPAVTASVLVTSVLLMLVLERVAPFHRAWNAKPDRWDLIFIIANRAVDGAVIGGTTWLVTKLHDAGTGLSVWPTEWPLLLQAVTGMLIAEFIRYGLHRGSHVPGLLGRIHQIHHEPLRMYTLNGPRLHPGNQLWIAVANAVPMLFLGASLDAVLLAIGITTFFVIFQHSNVRLRFDGINRLFATPDVHRLHHLRRAAGAPAANYGIVVMLFDMLFGTWEPAGADVAVDGIGPTPAA